MVDSNEDRLKIKLKNIAKNKMFSKLKWYVINTYSGFENKAKESLTDNIKKKEYENYFGEILIPMEKIDKICNGEMRSQNVKCFPSYIFVQMKLTEETGYLVRNTYKIIGFVGNNKNPSSLTSKEVEKMRFVSIKTAKKRKITKYYVGDSVRVIDGPFSNFNGSIDEVKHDKHKIRVMVLIFGRSTPVEFDYVQVEKTS
jgi:transcriptional antiterminator NusG